MVPAAWHLASIMFGIHFYFSPTGGLYFILCSSYPYGWQAWGSVEESRSWPYIFSAHSACGAIQFLQPYGIRTFREHNLPGFAIIHIQKRFLPKPLAGFMMLITSKTCAPLQARHLGRSQNQTNYSGNSNDHSGVYKWMAFFTKENGARPVKACRHLQPKEPPHE
ncbi:hypothetical protein BD779DRAFT_778144 [Infundibulicybe gibba]|nr:hypothetical protein BD779DRAFT_778144 [Infundibulicybe gibba]